jgi:hypothetical protein
MPYEGRTPGTAGEAKAALLTKNLPSRTGASNVTGFRTVPFRFDQTNVSRCYWRFEKAQLCP